MILLYSSSTQDAHEWVRYTYLWGQCWIATAIRLSIGICCNHPPGGGVVLPLVVGTCSRQGWMINWHVSQSSALRSRIRSGYKPSFRLPIYSMLNEQSWWCSHHQSKSSPCEGPFNGPDTGGGNVRTMTFIGCSRWRGGHASYWVVCLLPLPLWLMYYHDW